MMTLVVMQLESGLLTEGKEIKSHAAGFTGNASFRLYSSDKLNFVVGLASLVSTEARKSVQTGEKVEESESCESRSFYVT